MKRRAAMLVLATVFLPGVLVNARDPFEDTWLPFPPPADPIPDLFPMIVPEGLYYVTDTYVSDVVATKDATTTYSTTTVHESTGTYARVLDTVGTGSSSAFDGAAFNGRGALTDGRALAGTYYENFVLTRSGYVPVSVVFFQDDSETKRRAAASPPPAAATPNVTAGSATASAVPSPRGSSVPAPSLRPLAPIVPVAPTLRAGVALASDGPTLSAAEVLRGRLVYFWPRAFANDVAVPIRSWRLVSAQPDQISAPFGSVEPLVARWIRMPAAGVRWSLRFEIITDIAPTERLQAEISVTLRSPALVD
jgi:hypothetical protein